MADFQRFWEDWICRMNMIRPFSCCAVRACATWVQKRLFSCCVARVCAHRCGIHPFLRCTVRKHDAQSSSGPTGDPVWHAIFARTSTGSAVYRIAAMQSGTHESCTGLCIANWRYLFSGTPMQITNGNVIHHFF